MDLRTNCWIQWTNLTVNQMDRTVVRSYFYIIVILCKLLGVSQLIVIIILLFNKFIQVKIQSSQ